MEAKESVKGREISIGLILNVIKKFWILMLIATVLLAMVGGIYTHVFKKDYYKATASFWVRGNNTASAMLMAANYSELVDTDGLLRRAVSNEDGISAGKPLNEQWNCSVDEAVRQLRSVLSSSIKTENTCIFSFTATSTNKEIAYQAIDAVQYALAGYVESELDPDSTFQIQIINQVHSVEDVSVVKRPFLRNVIFFALIGAVMSFAICVLAVVYRPELLNSKKDIKKDGENNEKLL